MKRNAPYALTFAAILLPACFTTPNVPLETEGAEGDSDSGSGTAAVGAASEGGTSTSAGDDDAVVADSSGGSPTSSAGDGPLDGDTSTGDDGTTDDDTDDGTDDDAEEGTTTDDGAEGSSTDTGPATCSEDETCAATAPAGWSGPAVAFMDAGEAPECPEGYTDLVVDANLGLNAPPAECSCSCGAATGWDCSLNVTEAGNQCGDFVSGPDTYTIDVGECQSISTNDSAFISTSAQLDVSGASCNPNSSETIPPVSWDTSVALCEGDPTASCEDGPCLPSVEAPYGDVCIYTGGVEDCPAGPYSEQTIAYNSITDTRQCGSCECADPVGFCTGTLQYQTGCGGIVGIYATDTPPGCQNVGADPGAIFFNGDATVGCASQGGDASGAATPLGAVTVCCMPS